MDCRVPGQFHFQSFLNPNVNTNRNNMFISDLLTDPINLHRLEAHSELVMSQFYR